MSKMMIGEKLKKLRVAHKYSQAQIAIKLNVSRSLISLWESNKRRPDYDDIARFATLFHVSTDVLVGAQFLCDEEIARLNENAITYHELNVYSLMSLFNIKERMIIGKVEISSELSKNKQLFGLKISSDSINKVVPQGAIGVFEENQQVDNGEIIVALLEDKRIIMKRFYKLHSNIVLEPDSYNPVYKPIVIKESEWEKVVIAGKLVWYCMDSEEKI